MNNNENKNNNNQEETKGTTPQNSGGKSIFGKRWTFPVIYLAASVLIVGLMYSQSKDAEDYSMDPSNQGPIAGPSVPGDNPSAPVTSTNFVWPVGEGGEDAVISLDFYREDASEDERSMAVIAYEKTFTPNQGVNLGLANDASFTVIAAEKGTVLDVKEDPLMGWTVEIDHGNGYTTYYASLSGVEVKKGDKVMQSQPIAKTGNNKFEVAEKNHLHFEVRKQGAAVDPQSLLPKKPSAYEQAKAAGKLKTEDASETSTKPEEKKDGAAAGTSQETNKDANKDSGKQEEKTPDGAAKSTDTPAEKDAATDADKKEAPSMIESNGPDHGVN